MKSHIAGLLAGLALTSYAQAEVVMFDFTATIASIVKEHGPHEPGPGYMINGALMAPGYTLKGTISINLDMPQLWGGASHAYYDDSSQKSGASFSVDQTGYVYSSGPTANTGIFLWDHLPGTGSDSFNAQILSDTLNAEHNPLTAERTTFQFDQADGKMLSALDPSGVPLLPTALNFAGFDSATMVYSFTDYITAPGSSAWNNSYQVTTNLTSLKLHSTSPVPEPSAYLMLTAGMLAIGTVVRRRQRQGGHS
ncbi:PEP-CTERM sorting domain-containing protein [Massilia pseudoviolaceinigra]|uniref:PEP-CTERM sorting domain-containing protein n=1 Tax=Massilia pseudoviolaceinigra TaxID=3057165 RepID=UPI0027963E94|nr:PEP-CTERM sorting domain-containing protein [Massilia sp. CCM 9206]MDQ1921535.1 PEP-CTERM sorting domain-containing protein [Massilia sp. CCM 9206]